MQRMTKRYWNVLLPRLKSNVDHWQIPPWLQHQNTSESLCRSLLNICTSTAPRDKIAHFIAVGCFPLFRPDKYRKNKHSRSARRPCSAHQNNIQAAAGARAHGARSPQRCIMSDLQHQLLPVHHPAVLPKNRRSDTHVHASALYVHARPPAVTSRLGFHILSYTIFSPNAVNAALCSGPVLHYGPRHVSHTIRRVRQKRGSPSDVVLRR